ncbi:MAG: histidine phosphatase family protein [Spirochaetales bacterium]|nr:histidine phosphatase family protein [Spirochaetales bacterium]
MKHLFLLRHAKSSWEDPGQRDHNRPLNDEGKKGALLMGKFLMQETIKPDKVICSTAQRVRETWAIFKKAAALDLDPLFDDSLYLCSASQLLRVLSRLQENDNSVMIIGHNPTMVDAVELLTLETFAFGKYSTAGLCLVEIPCRSWEDINKYRARIIYFKAPKMLKP